MLNGIRYEFLPEMVKIESSHCLTAHLSVAMVFCGPHLLHAVHFVRGPAGPQTNWTAAGKFPVVWRRRRGRFRYTVRMVFFAGGPLVETNVKS